MLRVEYAGAIYHLMSRGDRREQIYYDDVDRQDFLKTLAEACQKTGFEVHAYPFQTATLGACKCKCKCRSSLSTPHTRADIHSLCRVSCAFNIPGRYTRS